MDLYIEEIAMGFDFSLTQNIAEKRHKFAEVTVRGGCEAVKAELESVGGGARTNVAAIVTDVEPTHDILRLHYVRFLLANPEYKSLWGNVSLHDPDFPTLTFDQHLLSDGYLDNPDHKHMGPNNRPLVRISRVNALLQDYDPEAVPHLAQLHVALSAITYQLQHASNLRSSDNLVLLWIGEKIRQIYDLSQNQGVPPERIIQLLDQLEHLCKKLIDVNLFDGENDSDLTFTTRDHRTIFGKLEVNKAVALRSISAAIENAKNATEDYKQHLSMVAQLDLVIAALGNETQQHATFLNHVYLETSDYIPRKIIADTYVREILLHQGGEISDDVATEIFGAHGEYINTDLFQYEFPLFFSLDQYNKYIKEQVQLGADEEAVKLAFQQKLRFSPNAEGINKELLLNYFRSVFGEKEKVLFSTGGVGESISLESFTDAVHKVNCYQYMLVSVNQMFLHLREAQISMGTLTILNNGNHIASICGSVVKFIDHYASSVKDLITIYKEIEKYYQSHPKGLDVTVKTEMRSALQKLKLLDKSLRDLKVRFLSYQGTVRHDIENQGTLRAEAEDHWGKFDALRVKFQESYPSRTLEIARTVTVLPPEPILPVIEPEHAHTRISLDSQTKVKYFLIIYAALYDGQSRLFKGRRHWSGEQAPDWTTIESYIQAHRNSRSMAAYILVNALSDAPTQYLEATHDGTVKLNNLGLVKTFKEVYSIAHRSSYLPNVFSRGTSAITNVEALGRQILQPKSRSLKIHEQLKMLKM